MIPFDTAIARIPIWFLKAASEMGLSREEMIAAATLDESELADPDSRVPIAKWLRLWRYVQKSDAPADFGLQIAQKVRVRDVGLVGYTMMNSPDLLAAIRSLQRFSSILRTGSNESLQIDNRRGVLSWQPPRFPSLTLRRMIDWSLGAVLTVARDLTQTPIVPLEVHMTYERPLASLEPHRSFFGCQPSLGHEECKLVFRRHDLDLPIGSADADLGRYLEQLADQVAKTLVPGGTFSERVKRGLWQAMKEGHLSLDPVSSVLAMSPRTLQRRLRESGTSFAEIRDEFRREMASELLKDQELAIYEVAVLLGYSEPSTFYRAFRRWHDVSPREYRIASS